ncbi:MAG: NAD+ synthase [Solirubrobacteraceae bacterium]
MDSLRPGLCQLNPTVGDIAGNEASVAVGIDRARAAGVDLVLFGELVLTGYPPEDLLLREHFLLEARAALDRLAERARGIVAIVGVPERGADDVYNAAAVLADGAVRGFHRKVFLPNYGVFDEQRYFQSGAGGSLLTLGGHTIGITVCEDMWEPGPPASDEAIAGATLLLNISASPYHAGKGLERERMFAQRARDSLAAVAVCAIAGGQDELIFDGHSFVLDHDGRTVARAKQFEEDLLLCDVDLAAPAAARLRSSGHRPAALLASARVGLVARTALAPSRGTREPLARRLTEPLAPAEAEIYAALRCGLADYVRKNGFGHVVLGLSGGIDSALVACIAADALGPERVSAVVMPSPYSSGETQGDARALAANLRIGTQELEIAPVMGAYEALLAGLFEGRAPDLTEENLQARIRGNLLMALSNKFGWLVLTTGNKSEMSVGYSTLYGDSAGGFAPIKDCEKTLVYRLARHRNGWVDKPIPPAILDRPPSAELRPDQRDEDSLPPYELLDPILRGYIEQDYGREELLARGLPRDAVERVLELVDRAEYKRRQAPPGIKITERAFGRDRRMPITNRFRG